MRDRVAHWRIAIIGIVGLLLVALWIGDRKDSLGEQKAIGGPSIGGVYRRPLEHEPSTLDPPKITDMFAVTVAEQIFDGLVRYDANLNIVPCIAQSWTASLDGLVWMFTLRRGVKFHHGRELTAEDVVYSFTRLLDPRRGSRSINIPGTLTCPIPVTFL
ncbi:MAG: hypothetical protein HYS14_12190 [Candidatus Rokubacteria bacterium]|nr:hypothetical protein [Candidatus Rokubacteria bacterium]